jgi:hypothetical protein
MNAVMVNTRIIDTGEIFMDTPLLPEKARYAKKKKAGTFQNYLPAQ